MRKVYINVTVRVIVELEEGVSIFEVLDECDYDFVSNTPDAEIIDTELADYDILDSK